MFITQASSQARVKNDTVGSNGMTELFNLYKTQSLQDFRQSCVNVIEASTGKQATKDKFIFELETYTSKDKMLKTTTNYLLAGQGLGV